MLERMAETGLPILLSTGMSFLHEIDEIVEDLKDRDVPLLVFQCTTSYPSPLEKIGLNIIPFFLERYCCPVGFSDHSGSIFPPLAAMTLGANMLEVHVTLSREMFGPDVPSSLTTTELCQLASGVRQVENILRNPVDKDALAEELEPLRRLFFKSIVTTRDLPASTVISESHLAVKKPGTGIPARKIREIIGRKLRHDVVMDQLLQEEDLID